MLKFASTYRVGLIFVLLGTITACYQKKSPKNERIVVTNENDFTNDTIINGVHPDSIAYVDTFQLIPTTVVFKVIQSNSKRKTVYKLPRLKSGDMLRSSDYIEKIAVTNVYAFVGKLSNNTKLLKASLIENENLFSKIIEDSIVYPQKQTVDSLNKWTEYTFSEHTMQNEWVYYEAIQWLENLYLTLENSKNSKNQAKFEELVFLQLENGTEMLERLSAYQDYPPIALFANYLITIIDCKYYTFDVTQLKNEVIEARNNIYISLESVSK